MTKFLNTDLDTTLGGLTPSNEKVSSQKAIKTYVDTQDEGKVDKTSENSKIYGTNTSGVQTTYNLASSASASSIAYRGTSGTLAVGTPTANTHATTKKYVDDLGDTKVDANSPIDGGTHTKITYDSKGLVTAGSDIVAADITDLTATATEINELHEGTATKADFIKLHSLTATATELNYVDGVTSSIQTQLNNKVSKSGDSMTNNLEMTNGSIYLEGIGGSVAASTSRLNLGTPSRVYAYLTGNTSGAFGIYSETSGTRKGIACYPNQNFFADATTKTIDLGRSNNVWKIGYIDTLSDGTNSISIANIINKVTQTSDPKKIYGTDASGNQTTLSYSNTINASYLVQRDENAQIIVPEIPVADENAASKKYVDTELAKKPDTTSLDDVAFSGSYNDLVDVPTYKTINSEIITGTGNIALQTPLSGTNGNVVVYTSTTGTLSELGFDDTPTQNSNKLVKSGPIWTELQKKINYTDVKNNLTSADTDKPLSAYQGKVLDEKITLVQQSTHDRGVVLNALTSQGQNYTITAATINTAGSNYTVGDILFLVSDMSIDTIINVTGVNSNTGAITSITLGQGGAFTTAPSTTGVEFVGGTGNGAKFNLTASQVNNSTLFSISNPQPNDFATVLHDEIHNDLRYVWKYVDLDNDGTYEWVAGYPITNIERNFYVDPIKDGELATNAVTTVKIANNNITAEKIADDAILGRHISTGAITDDSVASGAAIQQSKIENLVTDLSNKVDITTDAYQVYATSAGNTQTTLTYATDNAASTIVQRDSTGQVNIAQTPTANTHAASKKYVDDGLALKVSQVSASKRVYGTDTSGNQTTYDYDSFGKVDDVKVGTTSVVVNKIASLGTMAGESKDDYVKAKTTPIVAATKCKITYDSDGLVTAGADLSDSDIPTLNLSKIGDVTATATEVNVLDGITVSTTELNYTDGLTGNIQTQLNNKQATLVSGTNIKTLNNTSLLGSGNITIVGLPSQSGNSGKFLKTNGTSASWATLATVATSGNYSDLNGKPEITSNITEDSDALLTSGGAYANLVNDVSAGTTANKIVVSKNGTTSTITVNDVANATTATKLGSTTIGGTTQPIYLSNGTPTALSYTIAKSVPADAVFTDTTYDVFDGATSSTAGTAGLVKAPAVGDQNKYLKGNGNWSELAASDIPNLTLSKITDVTATASEVNVLDGITATTTELNYVDGVTSSIQIQLDNKVDKVSTASKIYGTNSNGAQTTYTLSSSASANTIAYRGANGILVVGTPTSNEHAATKKYVDDGLAIKQDELVSGTNIKTINNNSLLGEGNLVIDSLPSQSGNSGKYLTTNGTTASWIAIEEYTASEVETLWNSL